MSIKENVLYKTFRKKAHPQNKDQGQGWEETNVNDTLNIYDNSEMRTPTIVLENHPQDSRVTISKDNVFQTLARQMGAGGGNTPMVIQQKEPILLESNQNHATVQMDGISTALPASMGMGGGYTPMITEESNAVVRRLTPLECERLQGFPDGWTDIGEWTDTKGKKHKDADSPRYKALGNSIALPFWEWMAERMVQQLKKDGVENPTMASLFDGIGGFPLVFQRNGCEPVWCSEIEEFPIAVTKIRFKEG